MTTVQVCPECGQLFEYGMHLKGEELCSTECRAERAAAQIESQREWDRDELGLRSIEALKRGKP